MLGIRHGLVMGVTPQADPLLTVVGLPVTFWAVVTNGFGPYTWLWSFGDGATSQDATPSHAWSAYGAKTVTVRVTDAAGRSAVGQIPVQVNTFLTCHFSYGQGEGYRIAFIGYADGGVPPYAFAWDFGDGAQGAGASVDHVYADGTPRDVNLIVTDAIGARALRHWRVPNVTSGPDIQGLSDYPPLPRVTLGVFPNDAVLPLTTWFDFGDGHQGAYQAHDYAGPGTYATVTMITDSASPPRQWVLPRTIKF